MSFAKRAMPPVLPVGIDTDLLIQFSRCESDLEAYEDPEERQVQRRFAIYSRRLIERLRDQQAPIFISSITVAEYLVRVDPAKHGQVIRDLQEIFTVVGFNLHAASIASDLAARSKSRHKSVRRNNDRMIVSADTKIIASLLAGGAKTIYLHDENAYDLARHVAGERANFAKLSTAPADLLEFIEDAEDAEPQR
jgi:hypothetical protein